MARSRACRWPLQAPLGAEQGRGATALEREAPGGLAGLSAAVGSRPRAAAAGWFSDHQHGEICQSAVLLNPFCPFTTAKVLALKATVLLLLTLLIKARVQIVAGSALGIALLLLQTLVFLAVSGALVLAAGGAALVATQQRRPAAA